MRWGLIQTYARKKGINWEELNGEKIFELAENGDKIALEVIDDFYTSLAYSVYNLSVSLNPEKILIGGEITRREDLIKIIEDKVEIIKKDVWPLKMPIIERW